MNNLMKTNDFHWALFIGHLVIERLLKAYLVRKTENHTIYSRFKKISKVDWTKNER